MLGSAREEFPSGPCGGVDARSDSGWWLPNLPDRSRPRSVKTGQAYPQLCLGLVLDSPILRTGRNAITVLTQLKELGLPQGTCAADRAYTGCSPESFQIPARRLGYRLALDYKTKDRGLQGS